MESSVLSLLLPKILMTTKANAVGRISNPSHGAGEDTGLRLLSRQPAPVLLLEEHFAEADGRRRDFDQLVVLDVFQGQLQRHLPRRFEQDGLLGRRGADVGQLLL